MAIRLLQCIISFYILLIAISYFLTMKTATSIELASISIMLMVALLSITLIGLLFWIDKHLQFLQNK